MYISKEIRMKGTFVSVAMWRRMALGVMAMAGGLAMAQPAAAPEKAAKRTTEWEIDGVHSAVIFKIKHLGAGYTYGRFNDLTGTVTGDPEKPENLVIAAEVKTASVDTANDDRDKHLKAPDFFNAEKMPLIAFKSTGAKANEIPGGPTTMTGELTLNGVTKPISFEFTKTGHESHPMGGERVGGEAKLSIKRSDYGLSYSVPDIGDEVEVIIAIEATPKQAEKDPKAEK